MINGNAVGGITGYGKTFILTDEDGNEVVGTVVDELTVFDAEPKDVKIGKVFVSDNGVQEGTDTRTYRTHHASYLVFPGESFSIPLEEYDRYDYTKFQAIISLFNTTFVDSVAADKILIYDAVYNVNSNSKLSDVTKNQKTKSVDFNIVNDTDNVYVVHYNTYKEE
jgi:hypothetical protein